MLLDKVPQGRKAASRDLAEGEVVLRYGVPIGYALKAILVGSLVHEGLLQMPSAWALEGLRIATVKPPVHEPLEVFTLEGYRNADGSVGTRNSETVPASELVVGVQCGGSDAFSGVTANPAVGFCADLLVRAGRRHNHVQ